MTSRTCKLVAAFAAFVLAAATPSAAPQAARRVEECGPNDIVPWWPRIETNVGGETLSVADRTTVRTRLAAVEGLMRKTNYATPRGFAVLPVFGYHEITSRTELYEYGFALVTKKLCDKYDEHGADITVDFNPDPQSWSMSDRPMLDEKGEALYSERPRRPALFGSTATFGGFLEENSNTAAFFLLYTIGGQSPVLPATREEYLRAMIFTLEGKNSEGAKAAAATLSKTPYERWMEDAPQRKKRNADLMATIEKVAPAQAAKMKADMERAEAAETEKLKKADAYERAQVSKNVTAATALGDRFRAEIAAMSPSQRSSPAFLVDVPGNGIPALVAPGTPESWAIVKKNPAFYRATTSPLEPRIVLVHMPAAYPEYRPQQTELYKTLDWAAIKKLVNP